MVSGRYVKTFAEADMGMLDNISLNAPYKFFWVYLKEVGKDHIICTGGGEEMRLDFRRTRKGDVASVVIQDPLFGPQKFDVLPFKQSGSGR